jgi:ABC-type multidrug transport system ATPase subunit/ABC-type multidrug transport system permease subunit
MSTTTTTTAADDVELDVVAVNDDDDSDEQHRDKRPARITLKNVTYDLKIKGRTVRLLHGITCSFEHQFVAIMGSSGAGKTTLLNLVAQRYTSGKARGIRAFNNEKLTKPTIKKYGGYVMQDDLLFADLTVRDTLRYSALLRLPLQVSIAEKFRRVERLMVKIGLERCADTRIGDPLRRGVSGGERKRVSIGVELVGEPRILMLDEPTTGLDSMAALIVVKVLNRISAEGTTIITTIHQPSTKIYELFDILFVLSRGEVAYFGRANEVVPYMSQLGFTCPDHYNPADFVLDTCAADPANPEETEQARLNSAILVEEYKKALAHDDSSSSSSSSSTATGASTTGSTSTRAGDVEFVEPPSKLKRTRFYGRTNIAWQFVVLLVRSLQLAALSWRLYVIQLLITIVMGFLVGGAFWDIPKTTASANRRFAALFFLVINQGVIALFTVVNVFPAERQIVLRERAAGMYNTSAYFLAKSLAELPIQLVYPLVFSIIVYWMIGFQNNGSNWAHFTFILELTAICAISIGLAVSAIAKQPLLACIVAPFFLEIFRLFGGFFSIGAPLCGCIEWINYLSYINWAFEGLAYTEFHDNLFLNSTSTATNSTMAMPNSTMPMMAMSPNATYVDGDTILRNNNLESARHWRSELILLGMIGGFRILGYLALRFNKS